MDIESIAQAAGAGLCLSAAAYWGVKGWREHLRQGRPTPATPGVSAPLQAVHQRPAAQLEILSAVQLLQVTGADGLVEVIRNRLALTRENWESDAWPVVQRFCEFAQLLPASESHHHAQPGGLMIHTLEMCSYALTIRQGYKLPAADSPEDQVQKQALWSYAVFLAALLHDIGKPISDVLVQLYGADPHHGLGQWQALSGPMNLVPGATHYEVDFPESGQRNYRAHQRLAAVLLHAMVPPGTMHWLSSDPTLLPALIGFLDDHGTPQSALIKEIVQKADAVSVADNLKNGARTRFAKARQTPLIERLMWGLRTLASEGQLSVNRPGATLFIDPDGVHLWAVSATLADKVRAVLDEREIRHQGAAAIPTDNTRLFDTWQEYGALVTPPKEHGKGSVWWVRVELPEWTQVLTVLKFRLTDVYAGAAPGSIPVALAGQVHPVAPSAKGSGAVNSISNDSPIPCASADSQTGDGSDEPQVLNKPDPSDHETKPSSTATVPEHALSTADAGDRIIADLLASYDQPADSNSGASAMAVASTPSKQANGQTSTQTVKDPTFLDETESAGAAVLSVRPPVQAHTIPKSPPKPKNNAYGAVQRPDADAFFAWIQTSLGDGTLTYNESDSVVHFTREGMAIVTPRAFKLYLEGHPYQSDLGQSKNALNALQKDIQRGGYIQRHKKRKSSFHLYLVKTPDGQLSGGRLTTYIIPNPQAYILPVPAPNPLLELEPEPVQMAPEDQDKPSEEPEKQ